jgi:hypothetical protein
MADLIALILVLVVVATVFFRKTSPGVATFALLAGVSLNQLIGKWILGYLPIGSQASKENELIVACTHMVIIFTPAIVALLYAKVHKRNTVLSLLCSLTLGFLIFYFGIKSLTPVNGLINHTKNSGLIHFVGPYQNLIILISTILATADLIFGHKSKPSISKKKKH